MNSVTVVLMFVFVISVFYSVGMSTDFDFPFTQIFLHATLKLQLEEALKEAIDLNAIEQVKKLVDQGAHIGTYKHLARAVRYGHKDIVQILLQKGARVQREHLSIDKPNPLHEAAVAGHQEIAELLLEYGAAINSKAGIGYTPLHLAIGEGHKESVLLFLRKGADVHACTSDGETALYLAVSRNKPEIAQMLLRNGKYSINRYDDLAAWEWARTSNNLLLTELLLFYGSTDICSLIAKNDQDFMLLDTDLCRGYLVILKEAQQKPTYRLLCKAVRKGYYYLTSYLLSQDVKLYLQLLIIARTCYAQAEYKHKEPYRLIGRLLIGYLRLLHGVGTQAVMWGPLSKNGLNLNLPKDITATIACMATLSSDRY